ncbi:MAG: ORF6N domain-containing protein [Sphingobacteriia bacterium]|nr:MAG: ORF6N domain-containing protein [Sphingobacteriia bacterium]
MHSIVISENIVSNKIYFIREQKVMLDRDLAELYGVKSIRLREQVKRNINRFPKNFMFQLSDEEADAMVSQNAIPSKQHLGGSLPYVFSEHGVLMLANILKSERAIQVSIKLVEIFIKLREMVLTHKDILLKLEQLEKKASINDKNIQLIFEALKKLLTTPQVPRTKIGFRRSDEV